MHASLEVPSSLVLAVLLTWARLKLIPLIFQYPKVTGSDMVDGISQLNHALPQSAAGDGIWLWPTANY